VKNIVQSEILLKAIPIALSIILANIFMLLTNLAQALEKINFWAGLFLFIGIIFVSVTIGTYAGFQIIKYIKNRYRQ